jgi:hypothetical protein
MLRGEFIRADGLVIPNNITLFGARTVLAAALCNIDTEFFVGLVDAMPDPELLMEDCVEPNFAFGYARQEIQRSSVGWPSEGTLNGEPWFESGWLEWAAVGGNFDKPVRRLMLTTESVSREGPVFALSSAMPGDLTITPDTIQADRRFKYRIYGR